MALKLDCDGCDCAIPVDTPAVGRLDPCFYCQDCRSAWDLYAATERAKVGELARAFEEWREQTQKELQVRLRKLPDHPGPARG